MTAAPEDIYAASRPRAGQRIVYKSPVHGYIGGTVAHVDGRLCWTLYDRTDSAQPFIWCFREGLNDLHDWPTKQVPA